MIGVLCLAMKGANRIRCGYVIKSNKEKGKSDNGNLIDTNSEEDEEEDQ